MWLEKQAGAWELGGFYGRQLMGWVSGTLLSERGKGIQVAEMQKEKRSWKELCMCEQGPSEPTWELSCKGRWGLFMEGLEFQVRRLI